MRHELCRGIHAEQNAIIQAAFARGVGEGCQPLLHQPALFHLCQNNVDAGIAKIYYRSGYADELAREMLAEAAVDMIQIVGSEADEKRKGEQSVGDSSNESIHSGGGGG